MINPSLILNFIVTYRYWALLPLAILEGPIIALLVGFMVHLGFFSILPAYIMLILGDFIPDSIYYFIGRFGNKNKIIKKYGSKSELLTRHLDHLEKIWHQNSLKTMFISKLAFGFSIPLLITAGMVHLPYKKFLWQALVVTIFQYGILMAVGYYLGQSYKLAIPYIKYAGFIFAGIIILLISGYFLFKIYIKNKIINNQQL